MTTGVLLFVLILKRVSHIVKSFYGFKQHLRGQHYGKFRSEIKIITIIEHDRI